MVAWINQYSYVLITTVLTVFIGFGAARVFSWRIAIAIIAILLVGFTFFLRSQSVKHIGLETKSDWNNILVAGTPVVLQLYSEY